MRPESIVYPRYIFLKFIALSIVRNMERVNDTANDHDTELYLFRGGNYGRSSNNEKWVQRIRRFHRGHEECASEN